MAAFVVGRRPRRVASQRTDAKSPPQPRRGLGVIAFVCVLAHWIVTYSVPESTLAWPLGVALSLAPVVIGVFVVRRLAVTGPYGSDGVRVVVGMLSFFVCLALLVALVGRYDMVLSAILATWLARRLYKRRAADW